MGLGVFATHNINAGALMFAERPLIVIPVINSRLHAIGKPASALDINSDSTALARDIEDVLAITMGLMRAGYRELGNERKGTDKAYTAVYKIVARINHRHAYTKPNYLNWISETKLNAQQPLPHRPRLLRVPYTRRAGNQSGKTALALLLPCLLPRLRTTRRTRALRIHIEFATHVEAYRRMSEAWVGKKTSGWGKKVDEGVVRELKVFRKELTYGVMLGAISRLYMNSGRIREARVLVEEMRQR
uniref:Uncharacterized protein n=1 Tax=Psilocybe cubensis TaxID=181762 RepID=A0A8H7XUK6_PSICU